MCPPSRSKRHYGYSVRPRHWLIAGLVVAAIAAVVLVGLFVIRPRVWGVAVVSQQLKVGDCIRQWVGDTVLPPVVKRVRCDGPHFGEVFAVLTVPDAEEYPSKEMFTRLGEGCGGEFFDYAPNIPEGPTFRVAIGYPSAEAWQNGNRDVVCAAISKAERWASIRD